MPVVESEPFLTRPLRYLRGMGPRRAEALKKLGIITIDDLFRYFPRKYDDRSEFTALSDVIPGQYATVKAEILNVTLKRLKRMTLVELTIGDATGHLHATWFNQPYLKNQLIEGKEIILSGKVDLYNRKLQFSSPEHEFVKEESDDTVHTARIVPVYPLTEGLGQRGLRRALKQLVDSAAGQLDDPLPEALRGRLKLMGLEEALCNVHFPQDEENLEIARRRLIFEEFFIFECALLSKMQQDREVFKARRFTHATDTLNEYEKVLPFKLTATQQKSIQEIFADLQTTVPMRRLLHGDVGSGKTAVAAVALLFAVKNGSQGAFLVPTEVLAEQHYATLSRQLAPLNLRVALLTGSLSKNEKDEILADLRNRECDIVIGTHALLQDRVRFADLGLVVIDEQHKFGVEQRATLLSADLKPHLLVMTATPIPRTLGLTLYGDLDISALTELPAGRLPIKTYWVSERKQTEILAHIRDKIKKEGDQAYMIFPIIDETENADIQAAKIEYEKLKDGIFKEESIGLVHGRMKKADRDKVMTAFRKGTLKVLVATSVVEVGVDNPNATLMVITHAERFGLSQLHQFRGRIGRGTKESHCFLFGNPPTDEGKRRLRIMTKTNNGFEIAEEDLRIRGPGDFLGTRQSGATFFRIGHIVRDSDLLFLAREEAKKFLAETSDLRTYPLLQALIQAQVKVVQALRDQVEETK